MACFEYHITGIDSSILHNSEYLGIKAITVNLLYPDYSFLRTEYMTSDCFKANSLEEAVKRVWEIREKLNKLGSSALRTKIEVPYKDHEAYIKDSLYIEAHNSSLDSRFYPISQTIKKSGSHKTVITDRKYNKYLYPFFYDEWAYEEKTVVELCVYDSFVKEDEDWFNLYR